MIPHSCPRKKRSLQRASPRFLAHYHKSGVPKKLAGVYVQAESLRDIVISQKVA